MKTKPRQKNSCVSFTCVLVLKLGNTTVAGDYGTFTLERFWLLVSGLLVDKRVSGDLLCSAAIGHAVAFLFIYECGPFKGV